MKVGFHHAAIGWNTNQEALYERLAALMVKSVREHMPGSEVIQFTDQRTRSLPFVDRVMRKDFKRGMEWIPFFCSFMEELDEVLLLDSDLIVRKDLGRLKELDADLVIPVREKAIQAADGALMRVQLGVCYSRTGKVWTEITRRVRQMEREVDRNWWGIQLVAWDMLNESLDGKSPFTIKAVKQWVFNYTPKDDKDCPDDVWVVHYKGEHRKDWMLKRWSEQPREQSSKELALSKA